MIKNYYKILEISKDAKPEEIKKSYRRLAMKYHPDKNQGDKVAEEKFKEVAEAYSILSDEKKRKNYDLSGNRPEFNGSTADDIYRDFMDTWSTLNNVFRRKSWVVRNRDLQINLLVDLRDVYLGSTRVINFLKETNGPAPEKKQYTIKIPVGCRENTQIRYRGEGESIYVGKAGDLYIRIITKPHPKFVRSGDDLISKIDISFIEAILGAKLRISHINGKDEAITVPPGIQPGQTIRVKGLGMPKRKGYGSLLVKVSVNIPKKVTKKQRKILEDFNLQSW